MIRTSLYFAKGHRTALRLGSRMISDTLDSGHIRIEEGTACMLYDKKEAVFYNKVQVLNRDLSIQVIKLFGETIVAERKEKHKKKIIRREESGQNTDTVTPPKENISVLDALAATGLRSIRYLKEIPSIEHVTINDISKDATDVALMNCEANNVDKSKVLVRNSDATMLMYEHRDPKLNFDVIDLDPYGSAVPFLDAAVQAVSGDGGLLCVTCTDMTVLAGNYPEVCYSKYGVMPLKSEFMHEQSLRVLLTSIESAANRYKRHIVPWLSLSVDFYVRVFVRVYESPNEVKNTCLKQMMVFQSTQCPSFYTQPMGFCKEGKKSRSKKEDGEGTEKGEQKAGAGMTFNACSVTVPMQCEETGGPLKMGGPMWAEAIHDQWVADTLMQRLEAYNRTIPNDKKKTKEDTKATGPDSTADDGASDASKLLPIPTSKRLEGLLTAISEELKDVPLFYSLPELASALHVVVPTHAVFSAALINAGYRVSQFHHAPTAIKTDAPPSVVWDIMRAYCQEYPTIKKTKKDKRDSTTPVLKGRGPVAEKILSNPSSIKVNFTLKKHLLPTRKQVSRFPPNPEANWGPKRRAGRVSKDVDNSEQGGDKEKNDSVKKGFKTSETDKDSSRENKRLRKESPKPKT